MPRKCLNILLGLRGFVCYGLRERAVFVSLFFGNRHSIRAGIAGCPPDAVHVTHFNDESVLHHFLKIFFI